jgi:hypothetical protein
MARSSPQSLDVVVRRADGTSIDRKRVFVDPEDLPTLIRHMINIARRIDKRTEPDPTTWVGDYELDVYETGGRSSLFTVSAIGNELPDTR